MCARGLGRAEQLAGGDVDDREALGRGRAQRDLGGGVASGLAGYVGAGFPRRSARPAAQLARGEQNLGVGLPARPEELGVSTGQRPLVRGAQKMAAEDQRALVVEDRRLDGALQEVVGVTAEELVERVLARDVHRETPSATPG